MQKESSLPLYLDVFEQRLIELCEKTRSILLNEWLCDVADIMVRLRNEWGCYAPKKVTDQISRVEGFFRTVCAVMSIQLRSLVIKSLEHFFKEFSNYENGNNYGYAYKDYMFNKNPIFLVKVVWNSKMQEKEFSPALSNLKRLLHSWLIKIINVNKKVPRIELLLFPGNTI